MSEDRIEREMPPLKTPEVIVNRAEFEALKAENAKLRELLGRTRRHLVFGTKDPFEPTLAVLIDEIDGEKGS